MPLPRIEIPYRQIAIRRKKIFGILSPIPFLFFRVRKKKKKEKRKKSGKNGNGKRKLSYATPPWGKKKGKAEKLNKR